MTEVEPVFYDCEASDVEGYPIEIGWAFTDPKTGAVVSESHLIRPPAEWPVKESWDRVAERLHGITLLQLSREGRPAWEVARRMNAVLIERELFSDTLQDEAWLRLLFDAAGLDPAFTVRRTDARVLISRIAAVVRPRRGSSSGIGRHGGTAPKPMLAIWLFSGILLRGEPWHHDRGRRVSPIRARAGFQRGAYALRKSRHDPPDRPGHARDGRRAVTR
jgi:hypothetical protein